jgi:hypothetical protein
VGWILAVVAICLVGFVVLLVRGATVYLSHPMGYTAFNFGTSAESKLRPVSRDRYERILARFVQGDLFDELWVSLNDDEYGGLVLSNEGVETELSVSMPFLKEPERIDSFRTRMASFGYLPTDEQPFNVGMGDDMESLMLDYRVPTEFGALRRAADVALEALQGRARETMFVHAWRSKDGAGRFWITVRLPRDVLSEVP